METAWELKGEGEKAQSLIRLSASGRPLEEIRPLLIVQEVCRHLGRSRRQLYRYLKAGRIQPCARILNQWLFSLDEVHRFRIEKVPRFLKRHFWDVRLSDLSVTHHRDFILARLLEGGDRRALRWVLRSYPRDSILDFLRRRGTALLSERSWHFWTLQLGISSTVREAVSWRRRGRHWGGVA